MAKHSYLSCANSQQHSSIAGEEYTDVENEIAMLEKCKSEYVVAYYGSFLKTKTIWICMEFCGGGSVADIMNSQGTPFAENELLNILYYSLAVCHA